MRKAEDLPDEMHEEFLMLIEAMYLGIIIPFKDYNNSMCLNALTNVLAKIMIELVGDNQKLAKEMTKEVYNLLEKVVETHYNENDKQSLQE